MQCHILISEELSIKILSFIFNYFKDTVSRKRDNLYFLHSIKKKVLSQLNHVIIELFFFFYIIHDYQ